MAKNLGTITTANTPADLTLAVNNALLLINSEVVTVNSVGATTTGNGFVNGYFGATTLVANAISGGTIGSPGLLTIISNTNFTGAQINISANIVITGILTVNSFPTIMVIGNSYLNFINASSISLGNSTVNTQINSTSLSTSNVVASFFTTTGINVNSTAIAAGANVTLDTTRLKIGNSTVNTVANSTVITTTSGIFTNISANYVSVGNSTVNTVANSTTITVGANVTLDTTRLKIGNSTVNTIANSTMVITPKIGIGNSAPTVNFMVNGTQAINPVTIAASNNININCAAGNYFFATCNGSAANIYFTGVAANCVYFCIVELANGGTNTTSWANTPKWPSSVAPTLSTNTDILVFSTRDGGTTWRGVLNQRDSRS